MTIASATTLTLNNGVAMPALGFGVFMGDPPGQAGAAVEAAVEAALQAGYRLLDTAESYGTESEVGAAIARSDLARDDVFVTTKLAPREHGRDSTLRRFDESLGRLGLDHVDLYLIHWPLPDQWEGTLGAWRALEELQAASRVRAIGVSNFSVEHLDRLARSSPTVPAVNQVELHPYFNQAKARDAHARRGIVTQSWSPIGGVYLHHPKDPSARITTPLQDPAVLALAEHHGRTPAQIILRWHLQHGLSPIPKSARPERIAENADILGFGLDDQDMAAIDALDTPTSGGPRPDDMTGI